VWQALCVAAGTPT